MLESQAGMIDAMLQSEMINEDKTDSVQEYLNSLNSDIERYDLEKNEILNGSEFVGEENWAQDLNGEMGKIIGANEWKIVADELSEVGDIIDNAVLYPQLCLVFGAIALVFQKKRPRLIFFYGMLITGGTGLVISIIGAARGFGL